MVSIMTTLIGSLQHVFVELQLLHHSFFLYDYSFLGGMRMSLRIPPKNIPSNVFFKNSVPMSEMIIFGGPNNVIYSHICPAISLAVFDFIGFAYRYLVMF